MRKITPPTLMVILVFTLSMLTACGAPKPLDESGIAKIIQDEIENDLAVRSVVIDRRQTTEKEDIVYAIVEMENEDVHRTAYYQLLVNYYDKGGWILDNWNTYQSTTSYPLKPPSDDIVYEDLRNKYGDYTITLKSSDTNGLESGYCTHTFEVKNEAAFATFSRNVVVASHFSENSERWEASIDSENVSADWKYEKFVGTWEANWDVGSWKGFSFNISITDVTDKLIRANGSLFKPDVNQSWSAYDIPFDGVFTCEYNDDNSEIKIICHSFELTVLFDANNAYYYGHNGFSNGKGQNYNDKVLLTKTKEAFLPTESSNIDVSVSNDNELRTAINQASSTPTISRQPTVITLVSDIELISDFIIPTGIDVTIKSSDDNVFSLISTRDMDVITIKGDSKLTIENINITRVPGTRGMGISAEKDSTLIMNSGIISGHSATESDQSGGVDSYGTFVMNGGTIRGNTPGGFWVAGDVYIGGTFTMNGGTIGGETDGGASFSGLFSLNDGEINGPVNSPSWARSSGSIFTMNGGTINGNVSTSNARTATVFTMHNGTINGDVSNGGDFDMRDGAINGKVTISGNFTLHNGTLIGGVDFASSGGSPSFTMNGGTISGSDGIGVENDSMLSTTFTMNGGIISGNSGVGVSSRGAIGNTFIMNGGTITGNSGGGVFVDRKSTFIMSGGSIHSNVGGSGVNTAGTFTMKGGTIYDNTAGASGGGVNQTGGTFTLDGGWIFDNNGSNDNDISIGQDGTFNNNVYDVKIGAIGSPPPN